MQRFVNEWKWRFGLTGLLTWIYLLWLFTISFSHVPRGYWICAAFPVCFALCFALFLWRPFFENKTPFLVTVCVMQFMRFVILSMATLWAFDRHPDDGSLFGPNWYSNDLLTTAGWLMLAELFVTSIVIAIFARRNRMQTKTKTKTLTLTYRSSVYVGMVLLSILLVWAVPSIRSGISFLFSFHPSENEETLSTVQLLLREFLVTSKYFLLFAAVRFYVSSLDERGIGRRPSKTALFVLLLVSLVVIGLRIGINRKRIIADAVACVLLIGQLFPHYRKRLLLFFGAAGLGLVVSTSVFRGATSSFETFFGDLFAPVSLQSYLCGQYNVASALMTKEQFGEEIDLTTFLYTSARSSFGLGTFVKQFQLPTLSYYYNQIVSLGYDYLSESQIIPLVGEGAIYFPLFIAPFFSACFVWMGVWVDRMVLRAKRLEYRFLAMILAVYFGQALCLASNIIINNVTFKLAVFVPVVTLANAFTRRRSNP